MGMTLDEAIKHAEEVAEGHEKIKCIKAVTLEECKCAEEHRQLAEWLKDYKRLKEQEPKTGHWIEEIDDYGEVIGWHCDRCYEDSGFTTDCKWDFCPNCGAKMVEPQESEDKE